MLLGEPGPEDRGGHPQRELLCHKSYCLDTELPTVCSISPVQKIRSKLGTNLRGEKQEITKSPKAF